MDMSLVTRLSLLLFVSFSIFHLTLGDCPNPPRLEYGQLTDASLAVTAFPVNTTLTYKCRPGYVPTPGKSNSITCLATDAWSEITEFCQPKDCGNPGEIINGDVLLSKIPGTDVPDTRLGANATFVCNEGFRIVGRNVRTCTASGWNNIVPTCEDVICPSPPSIANGMHTDSEKTEFKYSNAVQYSCNDATFTLLGDGVLSCTKYGNWSGPPPTCKVISCSDPSVANAVKTSGFGSGPFKYKHTITYECNKGFTMKGIATVTCSENSDWSPALPTCVKEETTTTKPLPTVVTKPTNVATAVQTTKDHISEKPATTVQSTKDHISEATTVQTTKDHIIDKEGGTTTPNGVPNGVHNVGNMMLLATVVVVNWWLLHSN